MQVFKTKKKNFFSMTNRNKFPIQFLPLKSKKVLGNFQGGHISSDGGVLLLRQIDHNLKLTQNLSSAFSDSRQQGKVKHSIEEMLRQRIFALALGYEDLNDHDHLNKDIALQTAVGKESSLASSPTLCRFENSFSREKAVAIHKCLVESFANSFTSPPKELILDFDPTDLPVHGNQKGKAYNGYYGHDCFLPMHVFCGDQLLVRVSSDTLVLVYIFPPFRVMAKFPLASYCSCRAHRSRCLHLSSRGFLGIRTTYAIKII